MRVLHLINNLRREGAQVVLRNLATAPGWGDIHHAVSVREPGGELQPAFEESGVPVYAPNRYYGTREVRRSAALIEQAIDAEGTDLVHAHMADSAIHGWAVTRRRRMPLVITHHGSNLLPKCGRFCRLVFGTALMLAARGAGHNVAVSRTVAENLRRRLRLREDRIRVVANGVPLPTPADIDAQRGGRKPGPSVICVGRLVELKGQEQLIEAGALLVPDFPGLRIVIVGDGPLRSRLRAKVHALGLAGRVEFTGSVDDVAAHLCQAHVYVSTSHREGMPMSTLEAMAWEVPVVVSDVPGNRDLVWGESTGLTYPLGDIAALAARIKEIIEQPDQTAIRARRGRKLVEDEYSIAATVRGYASVYSEVLHREANNRRFF